MEVIMNRLYMLLGTLIIALSLEAMEMAPNLRLVPKTTNLPLGYDTKAAYNNVNIVGIIFKIGEIETALKSRIAESKSLVDAIESIQDLAATNKSYTFVIDNDPDLNEEILMHLAKKFTNGNIFDVASRYQTPAVLKYMAKKIDKNQIEKDKDNFILAIYANDEQLAKGLAHRIRQSKYVYDFNKTVQELYNSFSRAEQIKDRSPSTYHEYRKSAQLLLKLGAVQKP